MPDLKSIEQIVADPGSWPPQTMARETNASLMLVPPLAKEENGGPRPPFTSAARGWALRYRYMQASGIPACAHGLYLLPFCPNVTGSCDLAAGFDHTTIWVPADSSERPFILTQPYADEIPGRMHAYAEAHALKISTDRDERLSHGDGWYHPDAMPIRLTVPWTGPLWPIEDRAAVLLSSQPVQWPDFSWLPTAGDEAGAGQ